MVSKNKSKQGVAKIWLTPSARSGYIITALCTPPQSNDSARISTTAVRLNLGLDDGTAHVNPAIHVRRPGVGAGRREEKSDEQQTRNDQRSLHGFAFVYR